MSFLDVYRRKVEQLTKDIAKLSSDRSREEKKKADIIKKINNANRQISISTNTSTINSRLREIDRLNNDYSRAESKSSDIASKIAKKQEDLADAQRRLSREEQNEEKKKLREEQRRQRQQDSHLSEVSRTLSSHDKLHRDTLAAIEELKRLPKKINVLFLAANPVDQNQLRLDEEIRSIDEMIRKSEHRDSVSLVSKWAVRPSDVLQGINQYRPHIIHFSGHGSNRDEIVFQDDLGNSKLVTKDAIVQLMMASSDHIRLVFFNTCYSQSQAEAVTEHVEAAIGMKDTVGDEAARVFASQFYSAVGFGLSVKKAFNQAKALVMMEGIREEDTPELFVRDGLNPDDIVIVKPQDSEIREMKTNAGEDIDSLLE